MDDVQNNTENSENIKQKRERNANFTPQETNLLVSLVNAKKFIIENKKSDAKTWQDKDRAWRNIEKAFNILSGSVFRGQKHLKLKYEAMKRDIKRKSAAIRAQGCKTGRGVDPAPVLTPAEQKVKEIVHSVKENESAVDSDFVSPSTSTLDGIMIQLPTEELNDQPDSMQTLSDFSDDSESEIQEQKYDPFTEKVFETSQSEGQFECKPKEKRPFDTLVEEKIEIALIQKKIIVEELEQKIIYRKKLQKELEHKDVIHELEKQHLLLKIKLLEKELKKT